MLWDVLLQNASERIWLRMFWHIDLWKKIYYVFSKESFVLHQHGWGIFSATLKSFSRSGMVNLVCIVQSSFQRYRQITMILVQNKVNSNSCLIQNIGKNHKEDIFPASWIYRIRIKILRKQFHTMNRKGVQKLWNVVNVSRKSIQKHDE